MEVQEGELAMTHDCVVLVGLVFAVVPHMAVSFIELNLDKESLAATVEFSCAQVPRHQMCVLAGSRHNHS